MELKQGDLCPHCGDDWLQTVAADEPWYNQHLQCPACDSTYPDAIETQH